LTGILSVAEKNDFITLIGAITERMYKDVSNMFDSPPVRPVLGEDQQRHWLSLPLLRHGDDNKENVASVNSIRDDVQKSSPLEYVKAHHIVQKEENDAMTPQLGELKKEALVFFKKWQGNVLQRLKEINVNDGTLGASGDALVVGVTVQAVEVEAEEEAQLR
jgi:hypothetical protein